MSADDALTKRRIERVKAAGGGWLDECLADPEFRVEFEQQLREDAVKDTHSTACAVYRGCSCPDSNSCWHSVACDCGGDDRELVVT